MGCSPCSCILFGSFFSGVTWACFVSMADSLNVPDWAIYVQIGFYTSLTFTQFGILYEFYRLRLMHGSITISDVGFFLKIVYAFGSFIFLGGFIYAWKTELYFGLAGFIFFFIPFFVITLMKLT